MHTIPVDQVSPGKIAEAQVIQDLIVSRTITISTATRPVVAVDIDGVMANFNAAMKPFSLVAGTEENSPRSYNFVESGWFHTFEDFERAHVTVMDTAGDIPLNDVTAGEAISFLQSQGFIVNAVTARREVWRQETLRFFQVNGIPIDSDHLFFMDKSNKSEMHFDYLIDDAPKNIVDALQNSAALPVIYHQGYNSHLPGQRVNSMMEFAQQTVAHHRELIAA